MKETGHRIPRITGGIWICADTAAPCTRASASGFERMIMYLTGIANIRDVLPFRRTTRQRGFLIRI